MGGFATPSGTFFYLRRGFFQKNETGALLTKLPNVHAQLLQPLLPLAQIKPCGFEQGLIQDGRKEEKNGAKEGASGIKGMIRMRTVNVCVWLGVGGVSAVNLGVSDRKTVAKPLP